MLGGTMKQLGLAIPFAALLLAACASSGGAGPPGIPARAQTRDQNLMSCRSIDPDLRIAGCTALIESGQETSASLAGAYFNRGIAYERKGDVDRAIHDYDQVISLTPNNPIAFMNRSLWYSKKGEYGRAAQDYEQAIRLNPRLATQPAPT